ncbi:MAG: branched-chain amino acid ABC transporter permease [Pseudanabaenaceae cyanobacterium SKYGB_i_bin29]|nr:branched-chain amino acid ABC transporter permease [Pseudanabaenaceae cyanobacterium SKYG29]MDW8421934.1 branched-chain amino acid ABC transporter permease [Pseudanabaenaceae cyanobacterium SKYGB_i_bin29]
MGEFFRTYSFLFVSVFGEFFRTYSFLFVSVFLGAILGLSLYLPLMGGQLSLATPGFYSIGGYTAAILSTRIFPQSSPFPLVYVLVEILLGGVLAGLSALLVGIPSLRLRGIYFAIATIAFVEVLRVLALTLDITGKAIGISNIPQPFDNTLGYLWLVLPLLTAAIAMTIYIEKARMGRALRAIRSDEIAAQAVGINSNYYKIFSFTLGAILAGVAGAISAHFLNTWNPRQGSFDSSITQLAFVIIGGSRSVWGPVLGGIFLTALPEILRQLGGVTFFPPFLSQFFREGRLIIFGLLLILGSIYFPQGLVRPQPRP